MTSITRSEYSGHEVRCISAFLPREVIGNMVARDGVEPPTPAFSGLNTAIARLLIAFDLAKLSTIFSTIILDQHRDRFWDSVNLPTRSRAGPVCLQPCAAIQARTA